MSLSRKQKIIIFAMILVACAIGGGVFYKRHSAQKAKNRLFENPFSGIIIWCFKKRASTTV